MRPTVIKMQSYLYNLFRLLDINHRSVYVFFRGFSSGTFDDSPKKISMRLLGEFFKWINSHKLLKKIVMIFFTIFPLLEIKSYSDIVLFNFVVRYNIKK